MREHQKSKGKKNGVRIPQHCTSVGLSSVVAGISTNSDTVARKKARIVSSHTNDNDMFDFVQSYRREGHSGHLICNCKHSLRMLEEDMESYILCDVSMSGAQKVAVLSLEWIGTS